MLLQSGLPSTQDYNSSLPSMSLFNPSPTGDQNLGPKINAVNWTFTSVAAVAVGARMYGRLKVTHNFGWDDFWIVVSIMSFVGLCFSIQNEILDNGDHSP